MGPLHVVLLSAAFTGSAIPTDNVLLDFSATWCGPCQQMSPIVSKLEREGFPIRKVDVDQHRDLAQKFGISSIPAFVLIVDGKVVSQFQGKTSEDHLRKLLAQIPSAARPAVAKAAANQPARTTAAPAQKQAVPLSLAAAQSPKPSLAQDPPIGSTAKGPLVAPLPKKRPDIVARGNNSELEADARSDAEFLKVSARIHVRDAKGVNVGTGTVIDSRPGETTILTCGHIFRNMDGSSRIDVELFSGRSSQKLSGTYLNHNDDADVGLLTVNTPQAVPVARLAPAKFAVSKGETVVSVGCGGGADPTVERVKITDINRYLGPANLECSGIPQQGRSGGGLFTTDGLVIGVCTAADPKDKKGLYSAIAPIHQLLDACKLSHLYQPGRKKLPARETRQTAAAPVVEQEIATSEPQEADELVPASVRMTPATDAATAAAASLSGAEEAEIVCVIRPIGKPQAASKVVVIHRASKDFVAQLTGELENQPEYNRTTLTKAHSAQDSAAEEPLVRAKANSINTVPSASDENDSPRPFRRAQTRR